MDRVEELAGKSSIETVAAEAAAAAAQQAIANEEERDRRLRGELGLIQSVTCCCPPFRLGEAQRAHCLQVATCLYCHVAVPAATAATCAIASLAFRAHFS